MSYSTFIPHKIQGDFVALTGMTALCPQTKHSMVTKRMAHQWGIWFLVTIYHDGIGEATSGAENAHVCAQLCASIEPRYSIVLAASAFLS